ncbi:hypothetical protein PanWU01x14_195650 [Parasponia andersonii]|uniref:Uncharacterized protein n=1 Tax=Parasponia andersonii TaxID=3476 RepID=A0A2P5C004_PARAD|nr:hypothetical protein PanWU01x14_195650 [Parasponia andersonii]
MGLNPSTDSRRAWSLNLRIVLLQTILTSGTKNSEKPKRDTTILDSNTVILVFRNKRDGTKHNKLIQNLRDQELRNNR